MRERRMEMERLTYQIMILLSTENRRKNVNLLPTVGREVENQDREEADPHAGDDQVDGVEEGLPPHGDVEGDVQVRLVTAGVYLDISLSWD